MLETPSKRKGKIRAALLLTIPAVLACTAIVYGVDWLWGLRGLMALGAVSLGAAWGWVLVWLKRKGNLTTSHILMIFIVAFSCVGAMFCAVGVYWGHYDMQTPCTCFITQGIAGYVSYSAKSAFENGKKGGD
jgi:hypothetical protein